MQLGYLKLSGCELLSTQGVQNRSQKYSSVSQSGDTAFPWRDPGPPAASSSKGVKGATIRSGPSSSRLLYPVQIQGRYLRADVLRLLLLAHPQVRRPEPVILLLIFFLFFFLFPFVILFVFLFIFILFFLSFYIRSSRLWACAMPLPPFLPLKTIPTAPLPLWKGLVPSASG